MALNYDELIDKLIKLYDIKGSIESVSMFGNGHINSTFDVKLRDGDGEHRYIVQRINNAVFTQPRNIMDNIRIVSDWIHRKACPCGSCEVLSFYDTLSGDNFAILDDPDAYWRIADFIDGTVTYEQIQSAEMMCKTGAAFGTFQRLLSDMPMEKLSETIKNFHNTPERLNDFFAKVNEDRVNRAGEVEPEIEFFRENREHFSTLERLRQDGTLPTRVIHNDTKCNNILFDASTGEPKTVIDLDTVMPGLSAYDFGDAVRCAANYAPEDETQLDKVGVNIDYYAGFTKGFIGAAREFLTPAELKYMALGAPTIAFELASRFLADYLDGDRYFKIDRPSHNLDRARCQIALCKDMLDKFDILNKIVEDCCK